MSMNRIMFAGTGSGCGKTAVTCAVMQALKNEGMQVIPFKCGPDYIDPMFHGHITGNSPTNLDSFFLDEDGVCALMARRLRAAGDLGIGIVEGVMGLFDGQGIGWHASSFEIAKITKTPVVLVMNARGMAFSIVAMIRGYVDMAKTLGGDNLIRAVILNQVGKGMYMYLKTLIERETGVLVLGYFPQIKEAVLPSRHLGLVTADEIRDLDERMSVMAQTAQASIDLSLLKRLSEDVPRISESSKKNPTALEAKTGITPSLRLAVARDEAFCFYYDENFHLLTELGAECVFFSPLHDSRLPDNICGLYIGGGYPELFAKSLSENTAMLQDIRTAFDRKLPLIAECGGFMYLHETLTDSEGKVFSMAGVIKGGCVMTNKLGPFGYITMTADCDTVFGPAGHQIKGHEFHYSRSDDSGACYCMQKDNGRSWTSVHGDSWYYAGYPHLYLPSAPECGARFVKAMERYALLAVHNDRSETYGYRRPYSGVSMR